MKNLLLIIILLSPNAIIFSQTKVQSKQGFTVEIDDNQKNLDIKEVKFMSADNVGIYELYTNDSFVDQVNDQLFHMDKNNKLWDINVDKRTIAWCNDPLTLSFANKIHDVKRGKKIRERRKTIFMNAFNGVRFVFEPNFGPLINQGDNKITLESFASISKIGLETNLYKSWIGLQAVLFYPGIIEFDAQSPVINSINTNSTNITSSVSVDVDLGWAFGVTIFDGVLVIGYGRLNYDTRDFVPNTIESFQRDSFFYVNLQPIASVRKAIAALNTY